MSANAEIIAELRRVLNERDEAREQLDLTKRELGRWVDREAKAVRERDESRADLARSVAAWESAGMQGRTAHDAMLALAKERDDAFRRGAEAMREAAANALTMAGQGTLCSTNECAHWGRYVRALPISEEP